MYVYGHIRTNMSVHLSYILCTDIHYLFFFHLPPPLKIILMVFKIMASSKAMERFLT